jgi:hypothetical protein
MLCLSLQEKIMKRLLILACVGSLAFALTAGAADEPNNNPPKKSKGGNPAAVVTAPKGQTSVHANTQVRSQHFNSTMPLRTTGGNQTNVTLHRNTLNSHVATQNNVGVRNQMNVHRQHANVTITNNWNGQQFSNQRYAAFLPFFVNKPGRLRRCFPAEASTVYLLLYQVSLRVLLPENLLGRLYILQTRNARG